MLNSTNNLGTRGLGDRVAFMVGVGLALVAIALLARSARGQDVHEPFQLVGSVVDAQSRQVLVGAWVTFSGSDWGSITDDRGRFRLPDVTEGPLALTVEQLGYETLYWEGDVRQADGSVTLALNPQPIVLEGLRVVTDRFRARRNAVATTVFAYGPSELSTTTQTTALDYIRLRTGSGTQYCNGRRGDTCLYIRGRLVEPVVYIDEAPMLGGLSYLESFSPHDLYMIEVYGGGRHIRAYTPGFMERAAKVRLSPIPLMN